MEFNAMENITWCPICGGILEVIQYPVKGVIEKFWYCPECQFETPYEAISPNLVKESEET